MPAPRSTGEPDTDEARDTGGRPDTDEGPDAAEDPGAETAADPLRERLLDAAARVFAAKGYSGTKIMDIVRESGLSSGAVYGRFRSKNDLLIEAVVSRWIKQAGARAADDRRVGDLVVHIAAERIGPLSDVEAMQLEAYVTARREPEVAKAIAQSRRRRRNHAQPLVKSAQADGTVAPEVDPNAVLYLMETMRLGLLLQRAAGTPPPRGDGWPRLIRRLVESLADQ